MKEIIIKVPDSKFEFVMELIKNLGIKFSLKKEDKEFEVPQWQQDLVKQRIETATTNDYIPLEDALKQIKRK